MKRSLFRTACAAFGLLASSSLALADAPQATSATAAATSPMQAAPDVNLHVQAPKTRYPANCLFANCPGTKVGLGKGDFIVRLSAMGLITNNTHSSVNLRNAPAPLNGRQGHLNATNQAAPEFTFEYFFTDHISLDAIAASTRHEAKAVGTKAGNVDVGSFWVLPPTLTLAWHFRPHKRFNPYAGIGITVAFFHNTSAAHNNLGLGNNTFNKLKLNPTVGPSFNLGFDYQVVGNWFFNFDIKQILLLDTPIHINHHNSGVVGRVHAHDSINPTVVAAGIGYRF